MSVEDTSYSLSKFFAMPIFKSDDYDPHDHYSSDYEEETDRYNARIRDTQRPFPIQDDEDEDDDDRDFFSGPDIPDPPKKKEKAPALKPEDPDYWDQDESEWEHLIPRRRLPLWVWIASSAVIILLGIAFYLRFFSPYREAATQYGYVESIETRGTVFKTIEGVLLPYKNIMDTTRVYERDFNFTVKDKKVAAQIYSAMTKNRPIRVTYKEYAATIPWRGDSKIIVTDAVTVDPENILPPDRTPRIE